MRFCATQRAHVSTRHWHVEFVIHNDQEHLCSICKDKSYTADERKGMNTIREMKSPIEHTSFLSVSSTNPIRQCQIQQKCIHHQENRQSDHRHTMQDRLKFRHEFIMGHSFCMQQKPTR